MGWLLLALAGIAIVAVPAPRTTGPAIDRHVRVEARSFAYSPSTIRVNPGDRVTIDLVAEDVVHGLRLDGYDLQVTADPGRTSRLTFVADRPGTFRFRCSVTCGTLHPFMVGKLAVGPDWWLWRAGGLALLATLAGVRLGRRRERAP